MSAARRMEYALADKRSHFRIAAENPAKIRRLRELLASHPERRVLIMGEYIAQVEAIAAEIKAPLLTGKTPQPEREQVYEHFRRNELGCLVLSKAGNFAVDLPDADVLIQVSGAFGYRQEEAQRLGRILRPKADGRTAHFFTLVSERHPRRRVRAPPKAVPHRAGLLIPGGRRGWLKQVQGVGAFCSPNAMAVA